MTLPLWITEAVTGELRVCENFPYSSMFLPQIGWG
jgi:hypothetical protein